MYINSNDEAVEALNKLKKKNPLRGFLERETRANTNRLLGLNIFDYHIMPVARIPRYELLLNVGRLCVCVCVGGCKKGGRDGGGSRCVDEIVGSCCSCSLSLVSSPQLSVFLSPTPSNTFLHLPTPLAGLAGQHAGIPCGLRGPPRGGGGDQGRGRSPQRVEAAEGRLQPVGVGS